MIPFSTKTAHISHSVSRHSRGNFFNKNEYTYRYISLVEKYKAALLKYVQPQNICVHSKFSIIIKIIINNRCNDCSGRARGKILYAVNEIGKKKV